MATVDPVAPPASAGFRIPAEWLAVVGTIAALIVLPWSTLEDFLPGPLLRHLRENSEAYAFAALVVFAIPSAGRRSRPWMWAWWAASLGGLILTSSVGHALDLPLAVLTLRESFLAAVGLVVYLHFAPDWVRRRPWPYLAVAAAIAASELLMGRYEGTRLADSIQENAEIFGMLFIALVFFDFIFPVPARIGPVAEPSVWLWWCLGLATFGLGLAVRHPDGVAGAEALAQTAVDHAELWLLRNLEATVGGILIAGWYWTMLQLARRRRPSRRR